MCACRAKRKGAAELRAFHPGGIFARELLDAELCRFEPLHAGAVELLPPAEERDRVVNGHISALEPVDDLLELSLELLEWLRLGQGWTSSTRAPSEPEASSTSSRSPGEATTDSRSASPPTRTMA